MLTSAQRRELLGLLLLALAFFMALSLVPPAALGEGAARAFPSGNIMGVMGGALARWGLGAFGAGVVPLVALTGLGAAACFGWVGRERAYRWAALFVGLAVLLPTGASLFLPEMGLVRRSALGAAAGWLGKTLGLPLVALLGWVGAAFVLVFGAIGLSIATVGWNPARAAVGGCVRLVSALRARRRVALEPVRVTADEPSSSAPDSSQADDVRAPVAQAALEASAVAAPRSAARRARGKEGARSTAPELLLEDSGDPDSTDRPPLSLLTPAPPRDPSISERELDRLGTILVETLRTFKVESQIVGRTTGPVVTQFEVVPAPGVKVNRIAALDADLALALKAPSVRIVAPIPGKGAVGVEVPNPAPEVVYLREILESPAFQRGRAQLPLALGKDLTGKPYVADLARMPHLLIAGATGSGKSVCINTIITSLIYRHSPRELRLLMIDPKMVELSMYADLPHLRHPVVTDPKDAATVLKWAVLEMERRYALLSANGVRSITEFNRRVAEGHPLRRAEGGGEAGGESLPYEDGPLPYVVVVVDELADLMMAVQAEIERPLAQLAQKARAIGIHLIVATQRPSVNVITGLIKANFPCRIAFRVSSKVDSRTILDQNGADALLGNGDMLFLPPGQADPVRIQGAYLATEDTERLMAWYQARKAEAQPVEEEDILEVVRSREAEEAGEEELAQAPEDRDPLFRQAAEICIQFQQGSTSLLQRRLRIGYGRAARIIDQLHQAGVLGPPDGSKPREVLVGLDALDDL
jgi:S-DNA-T family DNA segregation ATPase FtsK/SpoIIIE